jgi:hypothetical protein
LVSGRRRQLSQNQFATAPLDLKGLSTRVAVPSYLNSVRMDLSKGIYRGDDFKRNYNVNYKTLNLLTLKKKHWYS